jgi:hypothetical protein
VFSSVPSYLSAGTDLFRGFPLENVPPGLPLPEDDAGRLEQSAFLMMYAYHAVLPIMSIVIVEASGWALGMRAMMVTVEGEDYAVFAEAKGLKEFAHFLPLPDPQCAAAFADRPGPAPGLYYHGAAVTENFFNYNGLGSTLGSAISTFDYFMIYGICDHHGDEHRLRHFRHGYDLPAARSAHFIPRSERIKAMKGFFAYVNEIRPWALAWDPDFLLLFTSVGRFVNPNMLTR